MRNVPTTRSRPSGPAIRSNRSTLTRSRGRSDPQAGTAGNTRRPVRVGDPERTTQEPGAICAPAGDSGPGQSDGTDDNPGATAVSREAFVVLLEPAQHTTYEAVVSLTGHSVISWRPIPGAYAPVTLAEYAECELVTRRDPKIRAGLERRGITSYEQVLVEPWGNRRVHGT